MRREIITVAVSIVFTLLIITVYHLLMHKKIGYVKTGIILTKYKYMIEANKQYQEGFAVVQANIDTLKKRHERLRKIENKYTTDKGKKEWAYKLGIAENEYLRYNERASKQLEQRNNELTNKVIVKINSLIEDYGNKNNYKLILGTTNEGNILYGKLEDDLTDLILEKLNEDYDKNKNKLMLEK